MSQQDIIDKLPAHLKPFVQMQSEDDYTPKDQAAWRFILRHLSAQLANTAHPIYLEGLKRTGISLDHIPTMDEMNASLLQLGWRAIVVDGFIPPAIFMEFQALKILVIARDMRSAEHLFYTPAPDIVHESAGHAPFLADIDYAEFLQRFGEVGMKAIATRADIEQYEAIRTLSILKENSGSTEQEISHAEEKIQSLLESDSTPSEAALLTRLHWWTVEYGLVGTLDDYRIFGAGLLSSFGESTHCLDDLQVRKIPLTVDAVLTAYDITRQQPQLFVTRSCKHLSQVLEEFAAAMCFRRGGAQSLRTAIAAESLCTAVYESGVQVSGVFCEALCDAVGNAIYLRSDGPTQLAFQDQEIIGHGRDYHSTGFGSPIGHLKDFSLCLSRYSIDELKAHNIVIGEQVTLEYLSGITVTGILQHIFRQNHLNLILSFSDCTVTDRTGRVLFDPAWGTYDLAVGSRITSVYGGVADREVWQVYKPPPMRKTVKRSEDAVLLEYYRLADQLRVGANNTEVGLWHSLVTGLEQYPSEWLLRAELLPLASAELRQRLVHELEGIAQTDKLLAPVTALVLSGT